MTDRLLQSFWSMCCVWLCGSCIHNRHSQHHWPYARRCERRLFWCHSSGCSTFCCPIDRKLAPSWIASISCCPWCWSACRALWSRFYSASPIMMWPSPYAQCWTSGCPAWLHRHRLGVILDNWLPPRPVVNWASNQRQHYTMQTLEMAQLRF